MKYNVRKEVFNPHGLLEKSTSFSLDSTSALEFFEILNLAGYQLFTDVDFYKTFSRISEDKYYFRYKFRKVNG